MTAAMSEKTFQQMVVELATTFGWRTYHTFDSRRSASGFPDLVLVRDRVIWAELKSDTGKVKPDQQAWLNALALAGQETHVWRPADLQDIAHTLARRVERQAA